MVIFHCYVSSPEGIRNQGMKSVTVGYSNGIGLSIFQWSRYGHAQDLAWEADMLSPRLRQKEHEVSGACCAFVTLQEW